MVLVTDCRFINEADWIMNNGGLLIRVNAPTRNAQALDLSSDGDLNVRAAISNHVSETALDDYKFDYVVNNEPQQTPYKDVNAFVDQYFEIKNNVSKCS